MVPPRPGGGEGEEEDGEGEGREEEENGKEDGEEEDREGEDGEEGGEDGMTKEAPPHQVMNRNYDMCHKTVQVLFQHSYKQTIYRPYVVHKTINTSKLTLIGFIELHTMLLLSAIIPPGGRGKLLGGKSLWGGCIIQ